MGITDVLNQFNEALTPLNQFAVPQFHVIGIPINGFMVILLVLVAAALVCHVFGIGVEGGKSCSARHILMESETELLKVKARIEAGEDFSKLAQQFSKCPSGKSGGSLGSFGPGAMVPAFDQVCFDPNTKLGEVVGPVRTDFGYHLLVLDSREGVDDVKEGIDEKSKSE